MARLLNWFRRKLGLHVHEWGPVETFTIGGYEYDAGPIRVIVGKRTMHYQECQTCGHADLVYPPTGLRVPFSRPEGQQ